MANSDGNKSVKSRKVRKIREFSTGELFEVGTDMVAFMASHFAIDFFHKVPDIFKGALGRLGKSRDDKFESGDLSRIVNEFKRGLGTENMPETYRNELERLIERQLQSASIVLADGEMSSAERLVTINNIKRALQDEIRLLEQRYRVEPFEVRIVPNLTNDQRQALENLVMAMSDEDRGKWNQLREKIKTVDMIVSAVTNATGADNATKGKDFLKRLKVYLETPPKPDAQKILSAKITEGFRMAQQGMETADRAIKGLMPYSHIKFPPMRNAQPGMPGERASEYWNRIISDPQVQVLKQGTETDAALLIRLKADRKFTGLVKKQIQKGNILLRKQRG